ncbi:sensor histidine kinase [Nocardia abscessus]|uniref:ATP-binding protein n=1 Tax=Nocardia abscessus TaxID=120957 RepID=UPI001894B67C|nr:ATP-binding protein [Nocardia abscessus]MBF6340660.1 sensor histidine kinase [Nocardia abscessus]
MALTTSLAGRVRNTSLPKSHSLLPLLEAIVNGLQAIDARFASDVSDGRLRVTIERSDQGEFDLGLGGAGRAQKPIVGFVIEDNGIGFTPDNIASFETLDSDHKSSLGCRGVGRLLWLKAFDKVAVRSTYEVEEGDQVKDVGFRFSVARGVEHEEVPTGCGEVGSRVHLSGFGKSFERSAPKTVAIIAREVFEHCIWYYLRPGGAPEVSIVDGDETIYLRDLMHDFAFSAYEPVSVEVKGEKFDLTSLCLKSSNRNLKPRLNWCAANRVVFEDNLTGKVAGLHGRLKDDAGVEFTYVCYLTADYLDSNVRSDRTAFDLVDRPIDGTLDDSICMEDIRSAVLAEIERILAGPLEKSRDEGKARVDRFVSTSAPRYRPVLARLGDLGVTVDPSTKDSELEQLLHRKLQQLEANALVEGQRLFAESGSTPPENYDEELAKCLQTIDDINKSDLAAYVARRKVILGFLDKFIKLNDQGQYVREDAIHSLLMPMRTDSNEIGTDAANLWIIDERLAFHDYLASDKTLKSMPITGSDSTREPDIVSTRLVDTPVLTASGSTMPLSSIVVVEIKRPMRNDAGEGKDPIHQSLDYVKRIRAGGVTTAAGRPIPNSENLPAFCYILADLTTTMKDRCEYAGLDPTQDGMGYFGFNRAARAYIEVISFDKLLNAATERNRAFFDKLGFPSS